MGTLQSKLRLLRNWQYKTLLQVARSAEMDVKKLCKLEAHYPVEAIVEPLQSAYDQLAMAYGLQMETLALLLTLHFKQGRCENLSTLQPPLPEVARQYFRSGNFCVLDLETTGANPHTEDTEIVDIAIVDEDGLPLLSTLIKPVHGIPVDVQGIHGISDEMVKDAPTFAEVYPQIVQAIAGKTVIVYNADYDIYLLDNLVNRNRLEMPHFESWCLMRAYANYRKRPGNYGNYAWIKLQEACQLQGVQTADVHRALGDTLATYGLLKALAEK